MNKLSDALTHERVPLPQNMREALALVRAGKLQQASELLQSGVAGANRTAHPAADTQRDGALPAQGLGDRLANGLKSGWADGLTGDLAGLSKGLSSGFAKGLSRAGQALDVSDVLARAGLNAGMPKPASAPSAAAHTAKAPGQFQCVAFSHDGQDQPYWLYVPKTSAASTGRPLVLMLHGCTQDAQDFAVGTRMNEAAEGAGALVLYPSQAHSANANGCWNWFRPQDQQAGSGEPAMLLAMVKHAMTTHEVDASRIYVAGLSAGGAMAAVLAQQYPQVFAAVGVHSGLAPGAAHNMMGALSAMNSGAKGWDASAAGGAQPVPLIVLHGDADATVHPRNGEQLLEGAAATLAHSVQAEDCGTTADGQRYTRTTVMGVDGASNVLAEHWLLHGAGHAWSGGDARGSHASGTGVNASQEMLRFFLAHPRAGSPAAA